MNKQEQMIADFKEIVGDLDLIKSGENLRKDLAEEYLTIKKCSYILKKIAFAQQDFIQNAIEQQNLNLEYQELKSPEKKMEYLEQGKKKLYNDLIKQKIDLIRKSFIQAQQQSITIEMGHKELEKRLGFEFEVGRNPYMMGYVDIKCLEKDGVKI